MRAQAIIPVLFVVLGISLVISVDSNSADSITGKLRVPEGFEIGIYADGVKGARFMALGPDGVVYLSQPKSGRVVALYDEDGDGRVESKETIVEGLKRPHGIAFHGDDLWIAETGRVIMFADYHGGHAENPRVIVDDLPAMGNHWSRSIGFGPTDGMLYVSIGSTCNICDEDWFRRIDQAWIRSNMLYTAARP